MIRWLVAAAAALVVLAFGAGHAAAFDGFGATTADSTYDEAITFEVELAGGAPDRLELLITTPGNEAAFVTPVEASGTSARYVWDTSTDHVTPNTPITYQWRAVEGGETTVSAAAVLRYEDDRPGLDWRSAQLGEATVHWYGDAEAQARRFGEVTAEGVARAEELLGTQLAGPVDVFVYDSREDFFGALGPGAREWTGAAAYSEIRTIFMWLGGGSGDYLEQAMIHEVTHVVFFDATDNPFHEPARWLNEGIASWAEDFAGTEERGIVAFEASGAGLFSFEAISAQFPIGERGGRLSYAQGTTMVDLIVDRYGEDAIAEIAAAYRDGASDAEALEAGTGVPAGDLYASFFDEFGVAVPSPIAPVPIAGSNVDRPTAGPVDPGGVDGNPAASEPPAEGGQSPADTDGLPVAIVLAVAGVLAIGAAVLVVRRAMDGGPPA